MRDFMEGNFFRWPYLNRNQPVFELQNGRMLKFKLFGIPVSVDWWFWLVVVLIGGGATAQTSQAWAAVAVWTAVVFVSIIIHELGHAAAGIRYGAFPSIRLHGFGGVTFLPGAHFSRIQNIIVSAAGPLAGLSLGFFIFITANLLGDLPPLARAAVRYGLFVNFVWTFLNLLPIQPLDGGQILGQILGPRRARVTNLIGFVLAAGLCVVALWQRFFFAAIMLAMMAYYNYQSERVEGGVVTQ
jgi:stage IV sporulation protein FB